MIPHRTIKVYTLFLLMKSATKYMYDFRITVVLRLGTLIRETP